MAFTAPTVADFKAKYFRDFAYTANEEDFSKVQDRDITSAEQTADQFINESLFGTQAEYANAYLCLSAHFLCTNLKASSQGVNGQYSWLLTSQSVGSVTQSFEMPDWVKNNPLLASLSQTLYGLQFVQIMIPRLVGPITWVGGATHP